MWKTKPGLVFKKSPADKTTGPSGKKMSMIYKNERGSLRFLRKKTFATIDVYLDFS